VLTVTDLRQWTYCPRVVHYHYYPPARRVTTFKMDAGREEHERTTQLEHRRTLAAYGLVDGERHFAVRLASERLGLRGILDMAIVRPDEVIPVEYKSAEGPAARNHRYQLAAHALLLEVRWQLPVRRGFIYWIPRRSAEEVCLGGRLRRDTPKALDAIRAMLRAGLLPEPTDRRGRCVDCEFRRFCGDVA
jgi:CRISPR-associated exonuclease Cas4